MFCKTIQQTGGICFRIVTLLVLTVSLNSCVPLAIAGGAIFVGAVADDGFNYKPELEGTEARSSNTENSYLPPADDGGAGAYDMPVY